jgi:NAD(P)-dependent dehydrogenase (short-subunit alcohol dehydrogenase family)
VTRLQGRVALVTGGGNGLGAATARRFAEDGAAVVIADVQEDAAARVAAEIDATGGRATAIALDATSEADNAAAVELAWQRYSGLDVVVTAAGVSRAGYRSGDAAAGRDYASAVLANLETPWVPFLDLTAAEFTEVLDINLTGTLLAVQASARSMIAAGRGGSIITIASIMARSNSGPAPYNVSKAGVWMLTKVAARVLAPTGIRVNAIGPGYVETNMTSMIAEYPEEYRANFMRQIPMGRLGRPEEIAATAAFLASDDSSYFTGELLHPDGGFFTD